MSIVLNNNKHRAASGTVVPKSKAIARSSQAILKPEALLRQNIQSWKTRKETPG